jgi:hypothetical protein
VRNAYDYLQQSEDLEPPKKKRKSERAIEEEQALQQFWDDAIVLAKLNITIVCHEKDFAAKSD